MEVRELIAELQKASKGKNYEVIVQDDIAGGDYYLGSKILDVDFNITDEDKVVMILKIDTHDGEEEYFEFENLEAYKEYKEEYDLNEQKLSESVNLITAAKKLKRMFDGDPQYFDEAADIIIYWYEREDNINALKDPYLSDILDLLDASSNPKKREIVAKAIGPEADFIFDDDEDDLDENMNAEQEDQYSEEDEEDDFVFVSEMRYKDYVIEFFRNKQDGKYYWQADYDGEDRKLGNFNIWITVRGIELSIQDKEGYPTKADAIAKAKEEINKQKRRWNESIKTGKSNLQEDSVTEDADSLAKWKAIGGQIESLFKRYVDKKVGNTVIDRVYRDISLPYADELTFGVTSNIDFAQKDITSLINSHKQDIERIYSKKLVEVKMLRSSNAAKNQVASITFSLKFDGDIWKDSITEDATLTHIENYKGVKIYQNNDNKKYRGTLYTNRFMPIVSFEEKDLKTLKVKIDEARNKYIKKYGNLDSLTEDVEDDTFIKASIAEMSRYVRNWDFMSAKERNNVMPGYSKSEGLAALKIKLAEAEARLRESITEDIEDDEDDYSNDYNFYIEYYVGTSPIPRFKKYFNTLKEAKQFAVDTLINNKNLEIEELYVCTEGINGPVQHDAWFKSSQKWYSEHYNESNDDNNLIVKY